VLKLYGILYDTFVDLAGEKCCGCWREVYLRVCEWCILLGVLYNMSDHEKDVVLMLRSYVVHNQSISLTIMFRALSVQ
jgi:hypothetical protein